MCLNILGFGLFIHLRATTKLAEIIIIQLVAGAGIGFGFQTPLVALQSLLRPEEVASGTSTLGLIRNIANSVSVVIGGVIFDQGMTMQNKNLQQILGISGANQFTGQSAQANVNVIANLPTEAERYAVRVAYAKSLEYMWVFYTCIAGVGLVASMFIRQNKLSTSHVETRTGLDTQLRRPEKKPQEHSEA